jgi:hypothetical protein
MAYFAQIDENNRVKQVIVVDDDVLIDSKGNTNEQLGVDYCINLLGGKWVQTFIENNAKRKYAGIGQLYDPITDNFYMYFENVEVNDLEQPYYGLFYNTVNDSVSSMSLFSLSGNFVKFTTDYFLAQTESECMVKAYQVGLQRYEDLNKKQSVYINLPNEKSYALTYRNGSSMITKLIVETFYPDLSGRVSLSARNRNLLNESVQPQGTPYAIVRDPIDRFISSYALGTGNLPGFLSVDKFIDWLVKQDQGTVNLHFRPQTIIIGDYPNIQYYDFAKDLERLASDLGLPTPIPIFNKTDTNKKPVLTEEQIAKLESYYAADIELYNSISN